MTLLKNNGGPIWVPDYSKIKPSDMLFAADFNCEDPNPSIYMVCKEYFEKENCIDDTDIDYQWVRQYVPSELDQIMESCFELDEDVEWEPIKQKLLAAGFVEDRTILGEDEDYPYYEQRDEDEDEDEDEDY